MGVLALVALADYQDMTTCRVCPAEFTPHRPLQIVCSRMCAQRVSVVARNTLKAIRKADRARLTDINETLPKLRAIAQAAFNSWVRARDAGKPCICCGAFPQSDSLRGGEWDAGHFRSRGACPELAFDENNCHAQLKKCNRRSWDVASYRANLIERIGLQAVERLEGPHEPKRYSRDDLRAIRDDYRARRKQMGAT